VHASTAETPSHASDAALLAGVRDGDDACVAELQQRHGAAVSLLADDIGVGPIAAAWDRLLDDVREGRSVLAPVRVRWLADSLAADAADAADTADTAVPVAGRDDDAVWTAYVNQSPAWQTALWHALVEHDDAGTVATLLGTAPDDARRSVTSAVAGLRRGVVLRHEVGSTAECAWLSDALRGADEAALASRVVRHAREHGRHCDDCLPVIRAVFRVEHSLRDILAARVLGARAAEYLRTRPPARALALAAPRGAGPAQLARRTARPVLGALASGVAAAAVVSAFVVSTPELGSGSTPEIAAPSRTQDLGEESPVVAPGGTSPTTNAREDERIALVADTDAPDARGGGKGRGPRGGAASDEATIPATTPDVEPAAEADPAPVVPSEPVAPPVPQPEPEPEPTVPLPDPGTSNNAQPDRTPVLDVDVEADEDTGSVGVTVDVPMTGLPPIVVVTPPILPGGAGGLLP